MELKSHYTAKELAGLPGMPITESAVIRRAKKDGWQDRERPGRGGGKEYALESLPSETRGHLARQQAGRRAHIETADIELQEQNRLQARRASAVMFGRLNERQKEGAKIKLALIRACATYIATHGLAKSRGEETFAYEYSSGRIDVPPAVRQQYRHLSADTLRRWIVAEHDLGMTGLVDLYGNRKGQSKIETYIVTGPDGAQVKPMQDTITALVLEYPHITEKKCNEAVRALLPEAPLVSDKSVKRFIARRKDANRQLFALATNPDDYKNRLQPAPGSRCEGITGPNQRWEIDATPADLLLTDGRHKIIGLCDVGPRRLKFYVNKTERAKDNAFAVRRCLLEWGVPAGGVIVTDQGAPYKTDHFERILSDLNIDQHICNAFSGDEKPFIERGFHTLSHDLVELLPGYCGHSVAERKIIEARKSFAKRLNNPDEVIEIKMTSAQLQDFCDRWCASYHNKVHSSLDESPNQAMAEWPHPIHTIGDERALDMLLCEAVRKGGKLPLIGKKGVRVNGGHYWNALLHNHVGEYCRAFQEPISLGRIIVHIKNDAGLWEYLCIAEDPERADIDLAEVAAVTRALHNQHKTEMRRHARQLKKAINGIDIVSKVLDYREKIAAEAQGNVTFFPNRTIEYTTPGLQAAAEAAAALDGRAQIQPSVDPAQAAMRERITAELAEPRKVVDLGIQSDKQNYKRWKEMKARLASDELISEEEYSFYRAFAASAACRAFMGIEEELGKAIK